ncbi:glycosyltransferase [Methylomonas methanica]|uniref:Glycosyl transferase group 1 n=1 Tax=Methylomonas methanica (strain DSM 25384 / MC09) TaxID=857087 RepID=G0A242_METMM|nr:glycosyltransferase [Methylomonas methanica]AEG02585.1 glycosyl transferase group 1 [Methylomonas methanica MC09]
MKIAYLAPELPALSATFVYNEILQLEKMGDDILPLSVRRPNPIAEDVALDRLKKNVVFVYENKKYQVIINHIALLIQKPVFYVKAFGFLIKDIITVGIFTRNALGLVYRYFYAACIADQLLKHKCLHIHAHFAHVPGDLAMYAATMAGVKFSITAHANDLFERGWLLREKIHRAVFLVTISEFNKRFLVRLGGAAEKIRVIRCGIDFQAFPNRKDSALGQVIKIGAVCRLVEKKGIDTLIRAVSILKKAEINVSLYIAGSGPLEAQLYQLTNELGLTKDDVRFLGALPHGQVSDFIHSLDMFILPCRRDKNGDMDGIPVALMEAMAIGIPVISTVLSGIPELIDDRETGLLTEPDDIDGLVTAMMALAKEGSLRARLIQNAANKIKTEFSLTANTLMLRDLIYSRCRSLS